jgi:enoyl-CoA hydratase
MPLVHWKTRDNITRLTLNRPKTLNSLSWELAQDFRSACAAIAKEPSRVVVLQGAGKAFSAGGDLGFIEDNCKRPQSRLAGRMERFYGSFLAVRDLPQVVVAKVHGTAVGAGLCLALACDLRCVLGAAKLGFNFVRLGLNPGMAAWPLAREAFGASRARHLLFSGRFFSGQDLHDWGAPSILAATQDELETKTQALALELAVNSPLALRLLKEETRLEELNPFLRFEARGQAKAFKGPDIAEGLAALRGKRPPKFG